MTHVVITGGSRGIGAALVEGYSARGDMVSAPTRHDLDLAKPHTIAAWAVICPSPVDLLICNAGVYEDRTETLDVGYPPDMWERSFATNVTGVFLLVQALLPQLRGSKSAKVAIISSQMGSSTKASGTSLIYRASKAAALNLGFNLASGLKADGIAVGIYHPGWVRTDMGGASADISVEQSRDGLMARFDALSLATTGCFETWDGRAHPI
ncbi:MAG: SDR family NAD(P)-dependent oxidoreductase [Pseudomonadota bacterium]